MIQKKTLFRAPRQEPPRGMAEETVLALCQRPTGPLFGR